MLDNLYSEDRLSFVDFISYQVKIQEEDEVR